MKPNKVVIAWRTIYKILELEGYDVMYPEEIRTLADFVKKYKGGEE